MRLGRHNWLTAYHLRHRLLTLRYAARARALSSPSQRQRPVFIIGFGRSGTTLLRAMLVKSGRICIPPESQALPAIIAKYKLYSFLPWFEVVKCVLGEFHADSYFDMWRLDMGKVYREAERLPAERRSLADLIDLVFRHYCWACHGELLRWGDKTPYNAVALPDIHQVFPDAQFIHLIRDGRDCVASIVDARIISDPSTASRNWVATVRACRRFGAGLDAGAFLELRYEELVQSPEPALQSVCRFLDLPYAPTMLEYHAGVERLGDTALPHHTNLRRPLFSSSIGKWRERLSQQDQATAMKIMKAVLTELQYL